MVARWVLLLALLASRGVAAGASDSHEWKTNYYSVTGATLSELHRSLDQNRPAKDSTNNIHGWTDWRINWRYKFQETDDGCRLENFSTKTVITITLPRWIPPTNATRMLRDTWVKYINALQQHEFGHGRVALAAATELHKRIKAISQEPACESLKEKIDNMCQRVLDEYKTRDKQYDERTNHGATQGARLPSRLPDANGEAARKQ